MKIEEMASPIDALKSMTFYHGTSSEENAKGIIDSGHIKGRDVQGKSHLAPVKGAVYLTPHINYAQIYALGGDLAGHQYKLRPNESRHGHIFAFSGSKLKDIQPDEDSIGELVHKKSVPWLNHMAAQHLSESRLKNIHSGEYSHFAAGGKTLVKKMSDAQKIELIHQHGAHIANFGKIEPDYYYKIDKEKIPLLKRDGSNFSEHAEKHEFVKKDPQMNLFERFRNLHNSLKSTWQNS